MDKQLNNQLWDYVSKGYIEADEATAILYGGKATREAAIDKAFLREEGKITMIRCHRSFRETDSPEVNPLCKMLERHLKVQSFLLELLD